MNKFIKDIENTKTLTDDELKKALFLFNNSAEINNLTHPENYTEAELLYLERLVNDISLRYDFSTKLGTMEASLYFLQNTTNTMKREISDITTNLGMTVTHEEYVTIVEKVLNSLKEGE